MTYLRTTGDAEADGIWHSVKRVSLLDAVTEGMFVTHTLNSVTTVQQPRRQVYQSAGRRAEQVDWQTCERIELVRLVHFRCYGRFNLWQII